MNSPAAPPVTAEDHRTDGMSEAALGRLVVRSVLVLIGVTAGFLLFTQLGSVFVRLFAAAILVAAMTPPVNAVASLIGRCGLAPPRTAVAASLYLALLVLVAVLAALVLGPIVAESRAFVEGLPGYAGAAVDWYRRAAEAPGPLRDLLGGADAGATLGALAQRAPGVANQALSLVQYVVGAMSGVLSATMVLLLALYLTVDARRIGDYLVVFLPVERRDTAVRLTGEVARRLGGWARGEVLLCAIVGSLSWLGLGALGIPYALMLAALAGAMEAVPSVGPIVSTVAAAGVALTVSAWHGAAVVVLYTAIQQLENYLIVPRVMARAVSLHPLVVLVAVMVGAELLGPSGAVLAVPLAATLAVVVDELRRRRVTQFG